MQDIKITYGELPFYLGVLGLFLGVLFGSLTLFAGFKLNKRKLGWIGFVLAIVGGGLLGVFLSYPVALIFLWLILRRQSTSTTTEDAPAETLPETPDA